MNICKLFQQFILPVNADKQSYNMKIYITISKSTVYYTESLYTVLSNTYKTLYSCFNNLNFTVKTHTYPISTIKSYCGSLNT